MTIVKQPPKIHTAFNPAMLHIQTASSLQNVDIVVSVNGKSLKRTRESMNRLALFDLSNIINKQFEKTIEIVSNNRVYVNNNLIIRYNVSVEDRVLNYTAVNAVSQIGESSDLTKKRGTFLTAFERPKKYKGYDLHISYLGFNGQTIIRANNDIFALAELEHATIIVPDDKQSISLSTGGSFVPLEARVKPPVLFGRSAKATSEVTEILFRYEGAYLGSSYIAITVDEYLPHEQSDQHVFLELPEDHDPIDDSFSNGSTGHEFLANFKELVESKHFAKENLIFDFIDEDTLRVQLKESSKNKYYFSWDGPEEIVTIDDEILGVSGGGEGTEVITNNLGEIIYIRKLDGSFEQRILYIDQPCMPTNPFYVRWINRLGGYDYWMFSYRQYITRNVENQLMFKPTSFDQENNTNYSELIGVEAIEKIIVGSSNVTENEYECISKLVYSPLKEWYNEKLGKWIPIQVDKGENTNDTRNSRKNVEFTFILPDVQTQL